MFETVFSAIWSALFKPAFAAGAIIGGIGTFFSINKGWVNTPMLTKVKTELSEVKTELKHAREEIKEMKDEFEDFVEWRKNLAERFLKAEERHRCDSQG